jgi:hypothetical protein
MLKVGKKVALPARSRDYIFGPSRSVRHHIIFTAGEQSCILLVMRQGIGIQA